MKKFLPIVAVSSIMLLAACGQDSNRPYDKLNNVKVADITNDQLQSAKEVTYDQLVNGDVKKGEIIKVIGETTTVNDNVNDDDWGKLSKGDQFEIDDKDSNTLIVRNEDNSFKNPVGKKVTIYGTYEGVDKEILSKDDKKLGLTSEKVPLLIAYKVEKRTSTKPSNNSSTQKMITRQNNDNDIDNAPILESDISSAIENKLGKQTNNKKDRVIDVTVNDDEGTDKKDDYIALIKLNADDNLTNNLMRKGMLKDSTDVFKSAFKNKNIAEVCLFWYFPLSNGEDGEVLKIDISRNTYQAIDWNNFDYNKYEDVADSFYINPSLK